MAEKYGKGIIGRARDLYMIDPQMIKVRKGWNPRYDFTGEVELVKSIIQNGVKDPIRVKKDSDGNIILIDGERRLRATLIAIAQGAEIRGIPAFLERSTIRDGEALFLSLIANDGKRFLPVEEAQAYKRLYDWGSSIEEIAQRMGRSVNIISNRLLLLDGVEEIKEAINSKKIPLYLGENIIKKSGGDEELQKDLVKLAKTGEKGREEVKKVLKDPNKLTKKDKVIRTIDKAIDLISQVCSTEQKNIKESSWKKLQEAIQSLDPLPDLL